jgi:hypothetical protein
MAGSGSYGKIVSKQPRGRDEISTDCNLLRRVSQNHKMWGIPDTHPHLVIPMKDFWKSRD